MRGRAPPWPPRHFPIDFDQNYTPINAETPGEAAQSYIVVAGDTLSSIAAGLWGDASLWYKIAEASGLIGMDPHAGLNAGLRLTIPAIVTGTHNSSETFRVYDPAQALGEVRPDAPFPVLQGDDGGKGCGVVGKILTVAVAVAVVAIVGPQVAPAFAGLGSTGGAIATGAVAGAAGSVASQGFAIAIGAQNGFSFKQVGLAAVAGGVGGGFTKLAPNGVFGNASSFARVASDAARGVISSAATQGIATATGLQDRFSWTGVASAAVLSAATGFGLRNLPFDAGPIGNQLVSGMAGAIAGAATRTALSGGGFGDNLVASIPDVIGTTFGNAVGARISYALDSGGQQHQVTAALLYPGAQGSASKGAGSAPVIYDAEGKPAGYGSEPIVVTAQVDPQTGRQRSGSGDQGFLNALVQQVNSNVRSIAQYSRAQAPLSAATAGAGIANPFVLPSGGNGFDPAAISTLFSLETPSSQSAVIGRAIDNVISGRDLNVRLAQGATAVRGHQLRQALADFNAHTTSLQNSGIPSLQAVGNRYAALPLGDTLGEAVRFTVGRDNRAALDAYAEAAGNRAVNEIVIGGGLAPALGAFGVAAAPAVGTAAAASFGGFTTASGTLVYGGASFATGGTAGGLLEYGTNELLGLQHTPGGYVRAIGFGGLAATGLQPIRLSNVTLSNTVNGGIYGFSGDFVGQRIDVAAGDQSGLSGTQLFTSTATGAVAGGLVGDVRVQGVNTGRNNNVAIYRSLNTRFNNGNVAQVQPFYAVRAGASSVTTDSGRILAEHLLQAGYRRAIAGN